MRRSLICSPLVIASLATIQLVPLCETTNADEIFIDAGGGRPRRVFRNFNGLIQVDNFPDTDIFAPDTKIPDINEIERSPILDKVIEIMHGHWKRRISDEIRYLENELKITKETAEAIEAASEPFLKKEIEKSTPIFNQRLFRVKNEMPDMGHEALLANIKERGMRPNRFGPSTTDLLPPEARPEWQEILAKHLTPEQKKILADKNKVFADSIEQMIKTIEPNYRELIAQQTAQLPVLIEQSLKLPEESSEKLKAATKEVAEEMVKELISHLKVYYNSLPKTNREEMVQGQGFERPSLSAARHPIWRKAVSEVLTPEQIQTIKDRTAATKQFFHQAWSCMMLSQIDPKIRLTQSQREKIEPLFIKFSTEKIKLPAEINLQNLDSISQFSSPFGSYQIVNSFDAKQLGAILTPTQLTRWKSLDRNRGYYSEESDVDNQGFQNLQQKLERRERFTEKDEAALTDFLFKQSERFKKRLIQSLLMEIDDMSSVITISPEAQQRLHSAAKGACEQVLPQWKNHLERCIQDSIRNGSISLHSSYGGSLENTSQTLLTYIATHPLWQTAVLKELPQESIATWNDHVNSRIRYAQSAIIKRMLFVLDTQLFLTTEQRTSLEPLLEESLTKYQPAIHSRFSHNQDNLWFMQSHLILLPVHGIPEDQYRKILTPSQLNLWNTSPVFENTRNYWKSIANQFDRRTR